MQSYFPKKLEKGMWFLAMHHGEISVYELGYDIHNEDQMQSYMQMNGAPVEPYIYLEGNPNIPEETSLMAEPHQIGWFDEGDHSDEMYDIGVREINNILDNGGHCEIDVEEENLDDDEASEYINVVPVLLLDKVIIRYDNDDVVLDEEDEWDDESWQWEDDDDEWEHHAHYDY